MREILFRGKRIDNGQWIEGYYSIHGHLFRTVEEEIYPTIQPFEEPLYCVSPETVGQFTGLTDKNGKKIFEGDIIKTHYVNAKKSDFVETVVFNNGKFMAQGTLGTSGKCWAPLADGVPRLPQDKNVYMTECEIIGTIHDNPELLGDFHV